MHSRSIEFIVGLFMLAGMVALITLAFKVSGLTGYVGRDAYEVSGSFDNIGDLKVRAPVSVAGVKIGQVTEIELDNTTYRAIVKMKIEANENNIPTDSSASIMTSGLLGANYVSISPGFDETFLKDGSTISITHSALVLENLIGQFLFNIKNKGPQPEGQTKEGAQ